MIDQQRENQIEEQLRLIRDRLTGTDVEYAPGDLVYKENMPLTSLYYIQYGAIKIKEHRHTSRETLRLIYPNRFIGLSELLVHDKHINSAYTLTNTRLKIYRIESFRGCFDEEPAFARAVVRYIHLAELADLATEHEKHFQPLEDRMREVVNRLRSIEPVFTQKRILLNQSELALYLGVSLRTLTRAQSRLDKEELR